MTTTICPPRWILRGAVRGKFYRPNLRLNLPVYLDAEVQDSLNAKADAKSIEAGG